MSQIAFQDQGSVHHCHGCGPANEKGLRLKSYWDGDEAVAQILRISPREQRDCLAVHEAHAAGRIGDAAAREQLV